MFKWLPFVKQDPRELVRKWRAEIRKQKRSIDKDMRDLTLEQKKAEKSIKEAAQRNDIQSARILAKELVRSRKAVAKLAQHKATLNELDLQMAESLRNLKLASTVKSSTKMMESITKLMNVPQMHSAMKEMAKEMSYAGFIGEAMSDAIDSVVDTEDTEIAANEAVEQVMLEITGETMAQAANVPLARSQQQVQTEAVADEDELMRVLAAGKLT